MVVVASTLEPHGGAGDRDARDVEPGLTVLTFSQAAGQPHKGTFQDMCFLFKNTAL